MPYITRDFPIEFVNAIAHKEVRGKKPIYNSSRAFDLLAIGQGLRVPLKRPSQSCWARSPDPPRMHTWQPNLGL